MKKSLVVGLFAVAVTSVPASAQVMDAEEHRRPAQEARILSPPGTRTLVVALGTGHPGPNPNRFGPATAIIVDDTSYIVDAGEGVCISSAPVGDWLTAVSVTCDHPPHQREGLLPDSVARWLRESMRRA